MTSIQNCISYKIASNRLNCNTIGPLLWPLNPRSQGKTIIPGMYTITTMWSAASIFSYCGSVSVSVMSHVFQLSAFH